MPLLGFQKQLAPLIESGEKRQTIRAYRKDKRDPKAGDTLYLYTGLRTKKCRSLGRVECTEVHRIKISRGREIFMFDDFDDDETVQCIAERDGFASHIEMIDWFEKTHGLPFEGLLIRW